MGDETNKGNSTTPDPLNNRLMVLIIAVLTFLFFLGLFYISKIKTADSNDLAATDEMATKTEMENPIDEDTDTLDEPEYDTESKSGEDTVIIDENTPTENDPDPTPEPEEESEPTYPDLDIHEYSFSEEPKMGEEFTVHIEIKNTGDEDAEDVEWEWWSSYATKSCEGEIDNLDIGDKKTVECDYTYAGWSTYETEVIVDPNGEIEELDENNNTETLEVVPIHEEPKADLYISEYSYSPEPAQGVPFTVRIGLYNKGDAPTGDFWWEWWGTAYTHACREQVSSIVPNGGRIVECDYVYGGWSNYDVKAVADADNDVDESDETNNEHSEILEVRP